ncbi:MAG: beta-ketoacyl-[acyl-carrier-protein] synthase family protein [Planctomycetaceae bacterium]|jgi:3-oxoacyl-[acyl-carrier-protein] synthase II|nr:beta-ketoacyl-[acyl-carrier-protein] synthase family protein [Planctomycetaceae bacterium]MBT6155760.1 beta-ketoacyl-[acyl-carrier-protein] synthase family protein [Planctomycetaceae bacterium]MBT6484572.1 beta-ketoacyl-[acyl-carrier-protein] synthase family protein [Planctomycetaceae bacterium]MBT6495624.1 beta-ketoacyl-[acyl-carrier-protein] synthase family protein [Planctomycetaceae bacterium]
MSSTHASQRRVVITGMGILSPLGVGVDDAGPNLMAGKSGIGKIDLLDYSAAPQNVGGEVRGFNDKYFRGLVPKKQRKVVGMMCREIQLGAASAILALEHSQVDLDAIDHDRFGIDFGANLMFSPPDVLKDACWMCVDDDDPQRNFDYEQWGTVGMKGLEPKWLLKYLPNMPACHIGIFVDAHGPNNSLTLDEASANLVLGEAARIISRGHADIMMSGTTGTRLHAVKSLHASMWDELADSDAPPETWSRPFDKNRSGQVLSEGACSFVLEEETSARERGATIYGTILGAGSSCVVDRTGQPGTRLALANAMRAALRDAEISPSDIGHVNAHGLSDRVSDREEALAINDVFGGVDVPVAALKSYFGNAGSACGSLELAGSMMSLQEGVIPRTLNYEVPDPECPLNVVHGAPLATTNGVLLNINVTRMGQASALIVSANI